MFLVLLLINIGMTDAEAETPVLWPPHAKTWLTGKDPDAGRDWGQEEKGTTEDEMAGWHPWLDGHEFEWTPGVGDGQGGLACCDSWGRKESDSTEQLNWTEHKILSDNPSQINKLITYFSINSRDVWVYIFAECKSEVEFSSNINTNIFILMNILKDSNFLSFFLRLFSN